MYKRKAIYVFILVIPIFAFLMFKGGLSNWQLVEEKESPGGRYVLEHYRNSSDSNRHAPYGDYIFMSTSLGNSLLPRTGDLIFAGYCLNDLSFDWVSSEVIELNCDTYDESSVRTHYSRVLGVRVDITNYKVTDSLAKNIGR